MTFKYTVGQIVKVTYDGEDNLYGREYGEKAKVTKVGHRLDGKQWMNYQIQFEDGESVVVRATWIESCVECNKSRTAESSGNDMSLVSNAVDKVRQLAMNKDDRLLKKYEVVDECGQITQGGKELLIDLLFSENKAKVVAKLEEVDADEKESKKAKK